MYNHITYFNKLAAKLINLEESIKDKDKAILLMSSLPIEYNHRFTMIHYRKDKTTFDKACVALYNNELQKKD